MKLQYLGTAAAEGIPAIFCDCEVCRRSAELGGRYIRTRSQAIIDDVLLIDFPADTYMHFLKHKLPMTDIKTCIITHSHSDHLYPADLGYKTTGYSRTIDEQPTLNFYSDRSGYDMICKRIEEMEIKEAYVTSNLITVNTPFEADGYTITPLRATHSPATDPVVYIIEKDGKSIFYANDTSDFPKETWEYLKKCEKRLDLISFDCTEACSEVNYEGHMNVERCNEMRQKLFDLGLADKETVFVLNHFSHNGKNVLYDEFVKIAEGEDYLVSYDGMIIEI